MAEEPPEFLSSGSPLTVQLDDGQRLDFKIERLFTPVTKSVVLLTRCAKLSPDPVVVKLYDPCFINERNGVPGFGDLEDEPARPWSLAAERGAPSTFDPFDVFEVEPPKDDPEAQFQHAALWEAHFRALMEESFRSERAAYQALKQYQGNMLPRLLAEGHWVPPDERAYMPHALVFEYVEGKTLRDAPLDALTPDICLGLVRTVESFAAFGVFHGDLNHNNIILAPNGRAVILDFGCAGFRNVPEEETDEEWAACINSKYEAVWIRKLLQSKGVECVGYLELRKRRFNVAKGLWLEPEDEKMRGLVHITEARRRPDADAVNSRKDG
ncbi:uncharacterized protein SCHCODRAFT_02681689 [Schizophyllum commune H4-8]|uniref:ABC1 atypical kinase-like domain-containing protein n=1 Tax=Schizophyllum commune (strain H4-8 / FGSC 9210) TaxID=578458 RepID=D8QJZ3_SCHCM|nr:uncharacterized protein SCHCODRAFT_02681689 [Schizophyllum commune H4-8]KAI5885630.1 hypothetical protein SCHCODRAFT_02681689 [Schizophyllum commune H4-8]